MRSNDTKHSALLVGLTGGIGSGKSVVSQLFETLSIAVIDTDIIAHQLTTADGLAMPAISAQFGQDYLNMDGSLNRGAMRKLIFEQPHQKVALEAIIHPLIETSVLRQIDNSHSPYIVLVVPLLFESARYQHLVDITVAIDCPESLQIQRVMHRSGLSEYEVKAIMKHQVSREIRNQLADIVLPNVADVASLTATIETLHLQLLAMAKQHTSDNNT